MNETQINDISYRYPGLGDADFNKVLNKTEPYPGYWYAAEDYVLTSAEHRLPKKIKTLLDLGCGEGRLLLRFADRCERVVAIDPDPNRLSLAKKCISGHGIGNVHFYNNEVDAVSFPDNYFDVILLSHILEHLRSDKVEAIMSEVLRILKPEGKLIITTAHSRCTHDKFQAIFAEGSKMSMQKLTEFEFNRVDDPSVLLVHFFSIESLYKMLKQLKVEQTRVYHVNLFPKFVDRFILRDKIINTFFPKNRHGLDLMVLASKPPK